MIAALNTFRQDNLEMASLIKNQESEITLLQVRLREATTKANKYLQEAKGHKKVIAQLQKDIQDLKDRDTQINGTKKQAHEIEQQLKAELDQKIQEINNSNNQLAIKEKSKQDMERRMRQMQTEFDQKIYDLEKKLTEEHAEIVKMREEQQNMQFSSTTNIQTNKRQPKQQHNSLIRRTVVIQPSSLQQAEIKTLISIDEEEGNDEKQLEEIKRLPIIQKEEIADISRKLRYQLKNQHIELKDLTQDHTETISIAQLQQNLRLYPFDLDEIASLKVARYLVEDNNDHFVMFTLSMAAPIPYVRSILKTFLGNYEIFTNEQEQAMRTEISILMTKYRYSARDNIIKLKQIHRTHLSETRCLIDQLLESLADANFNSRQIDYVLATNYHLIGELNEIDYERLFQYFHYEPPQVKEDVPVEKVIDPKNPNQDRDRSTIPKRQSIKDEGMNHLKTQSNEKTDHQLAQEEDKLEHLNQLNQNQNVEKNESLIQQNEVLEKEQESVEQAGPIVIQQHNETANLNDQIQEQQKEQEEDGYDDEFNDDGQQIDDQEQLQISQGEMNMKDHHDYGQ